MLYVIGFLAQVFFSARILLQWILSERARHVVSPSIFWILSLAGSYLLFFYGWMRDDFAIVLGQVISYYIYIWNLSAKGVWAKVPKSVRALLVVTPVVAVGFAVAHADTFVHDFFRNERVPLWLLLFGSAGQVIFTLRFVYQYFYSRRRGESVLPVGFWIISLTGSAVIVAYGIVRLDPVLILGQSVGFIAYTRNILIYKKERARDAAVPAALTDEEICENTSTR
ncbi:lipid-A-disaccharide synthase N-terminal domain-containing protein [uncultured Rikenella sp.]|uniref:lipid-A-disaccharide synthase N-terminal domain-containing protein n=1 Tax=uncultured Rikenella sp. TaxID=368003 RepID=UPI002633D4EF|nr:lipid-A-disaccharide synthase N-terminal domain-containing protein [uncultured Rikenella sp.]